MKAPGGADRRVDARGLLCPLPTVKAALELENMPHGQVLELLADDPATRRDLPGWCAEAGHRLLSVKGSGKAFRIRIKKS
jgi:tRNA 2-thiouridine synthesizing protein A